jgi:hypothetical protein
MTSQSSGDELVISIDSGESLQDIVVRGMRVIMPVAAQQIETLQA